MDKQKQQCKNGAYVYGDDVKLMTTLTFLAYDELLGTDDKDVVQGFKESLGKVDLTQGQELVWGPAVHKTHNTLVTDGLMYIVKNTETAREEYSVVIRGTNPFSLRTWFFQDFQASPPLFKWETISPETEAPEAARISIGAGRTMQILGDLKSGRAFGAEDKTALEFLRERIKERHPGNKNSEPVKINFTGHSLGGLAAPTFALLVHDTLHSEFESLKNIASFSVVAFAGPTAGNRAFQEYSDERLDDCRRYMNPLDVVPNAWVEEDMEQVFHQYTTKYKKGIGHAVLNEVYAGLIEKVEGKNIGYTQVGTEFSLKSDLKNIPFPLMQAAYQHVFPYLTEILGVYDDTMYQVLWEIVWSMAGEEPFLDNIFESGSSIPSLIPGVKPAQKKMVRVIGKLLNYKPVLL